ncbi:MAG: arylesterase [Deltaproteobacteria bacterium]|nr:arylesterase [Deltaproteobacteria bacterium]
MIKIVCLSIFIILLSVTGCNREQEQRQDTGEQSEVTGTIVAVGDSLTAGYGLDESDAYPALLENKLHAAGYKYRVINGGVSGETSSGTLSRLEWILTMEPDIVLLETGANDGLRGINPLLVEQNIGNILKILNDNDIVVLLAGMKMAWNLGPLYVSKFNGIYPKLAREFNVEYMPFFLEGVAMKSELNQTDGLHPNGRGYEKIAENIFPYVLDVIKKREEK